MRKLFDFHFSSLFKSYFCRLRYFTSFNFEILVFSLNNSMAYRSNRNGANANGAYDNQSMFLEQQNDALADDLASKVDRLKRVTIAIGDEVRDQNSLINQMDSGFDFSRTLLGSTMKKLGIVSNAGGHKLICYLVLFAFFVFLVIYWLAR